MEYFFLMLVQSQAQQRATALVSIVMSVRLSPDLLLVTWKMSYSLHILGVFPSLQNMLQSPGQKQPLPFSSTNCAVPDKSRCLVTWITWQ